MCLAPEGWGRTRQGNDVRAAVVPGGQVALSRGGAGPPAAGAVCPSLTLAAMGTPPRRPADKAACSRQGPLAHRKSPPPGRPWAAGSPPRAAWMRDKAPVTDCKAAALLASPSAAGGRLTRTSAAICPARRPCPQLRCQCAPAMQALPATITSPCTLGPTPTASSLESAVCPASCPVPPTLPLECYRVRNCGLAQQLVSRHASSTAARQLRAHTTAARSTQVLPSQQRR